MMPLIHVFDLGDVLLFVHLERFFGSLRERSRPGAPVVELFRQHFEQAAVDRGGDFDRLHPLLVSEAGLTMTLEEFRRAWNDMFTRNPPMLELVEQSPRPRILLSNTNEPHVTWIREQYPEVFPLFDECVLSHEVGMRKPEVAIYRRVEAITGRRPEEHVFVDDKLRNIEGARAAGWQGIEFREVEDCRRRLAALADAGE